MPKVIKDIHDVLLKNFMETSKSSIIGRERIVFP